MARAILIFNLSRQDDRDAHARALKAFDLCKAISDFDNELRHRAKYKDDTAADEIRTLLHETLAGNDINLDDLFS